MSRDKQAEARPGKEYKQSKSMEKRVEWLISMDSIYTVNNFDSPLKQMMQTDRLEDELRLEPLED